MNFAKFAGNYTEYLEYLPFFGICVGVAILLGPIVGMIARKINAIDYHYARTNAPGRKVSDFRRLRKPPQALLGGFVTLIPLLFIILFKLPLTANYIYLILALLIIIVMGLLDDKYDLPYSSQILAQLLATLLIAFSSINLTHIGAPFGEGIIKLDYLSLKGSPLGIPIDLVFPGDIILIGWIIICVNAVKISVGTDGTAEGNTFVASLTLFLLAIREQNFDTALISIAFAGFLLGFLFYSFPIAKIRSGSAGKTAYGFIIAVLSVTIGGKIPVAIIILLLPLLDFVRVLIGRIIRHKPKTLAQLMKISDQTHFHHKLLDLGLSEKQIALLEFAISTALGAAALAYSGAYRGFILLIATTCIIVIYIFVRRIHTRKVSTPPSSKQETPESKYSY